MHLSFILNKVENNLLTSAGKSYSSKLDFVQREEICK